MPRLRSLHSRRAKQHVCAKWFLRPNLSCPNPPNHLRAVGSARKNQLSSLLPAFQPGTLRAVLIRERECTCSQCRLVFTVLVHNRQLSRLRFRGCNLICAHLSMTAKSKASPNQVRHQCQGWAKVPQAIIWRRLYCLSSFSCRARRLSESPVTMLCTLPRHEIAA
jgi:hypothetical protein